MSSILANSKIRGNTSVAAASYLISRLVHYSNGLRVFRESPTGGIVQADYSMSKSRSWNFALPGGAIFDIAGTFRSRLIIAAMKKLSLWAKP